VGSIGNPFFGKTFADGLGTLEMTYQNMDAWVLDDPGDAAGKAWGLVFDPDGGVTDLSPGKHLGWAARQDQSKPKLPPPDLGVQNFFRHDEDRYDGVRGDFEEQFLQLSRISNLITTRSDSFTCYVLIQGYRDAGTANPKLEVQKRVSYIIDRSKMPYRPVEKILVPND